MLEVDSITSKSSVLGQLNVQCTGAILIAHGITDRAWRKLINGCMSDFMKKYAAWTVKDKRPVEVIGQQVFAQCNFCTYMEKTGDAGDNVTANFLYFPPNFKLRTRF